MWTTDHTEYAAVHVSKILISTITYSAKYSLIIIIEKNPQKYQDIIFFSISHTPRPDTWLSAVIKMNLIYKFILLIA